jgi:hypothetical protein
MYLAIQKIYTFMEDVALSEMDKYSNIKKVDDVINGKIFWEYDDIKLHKYLFMRNSLMNRLSIAHLCQNPRFETLFEMIKENFLKEFEEEENKEDIPRHFYEGRSRLDYLYAILKETPPLQLES